MRIVFDNNIWISFLIGRRLSALRSAFGREDVEIYLHRVHLLMTKYCKRGGAFAIQQANAVRDPKDIYLLALVDTIHADYLVSGDSDLTDLKEHNHTKIVDFNTFLTLFR